MGFKGNNHKLVNGEVYVLNFYHCEDRYIYLHTRDDNKMDGPWIHIEDECYDSNGTDNLGEVDNITASRLANREERLQLEESIELDRYVYPSELYIYTCSLKLKTY